jgi:hypothetical protein
MQASEPSQITRPMDDVPSAPVSYNDYLERRLNEAVREAYARGLNRSVRRQALVLCVGLIFGCLAGFYLAIANQSRSCHPSPYRDKGYLRATQSSESLASRSIARVCTRCSLVDLPSEDRRSATVFQCA